MRHWIRKIYYCLIRIIYNLKNKTVKLYGGTEILRHTIFEGKNIINKNSRFCGYMGYGSYLGNDCDFNGKIGKYCSIASNVKTISATHPSKDFVSTHPMFFSVRKQNGYTYVSKQKFNEYIYADKENKYSVIVGNDVWIGFGAILMGGITIGDGAVIAAGAIVTKDVPPYTVVGGVPAKETKKRFTDKQIEFLLDYKWWNKSEVWIQENIDKFENIIEFAKDLDE